MLHTSFMLFVFSSAFVFVNATETLDFNSNVIIEDSTRVEGFPKDTIWHTSKDSLKDQFVLRNIFFQLGAAELLSYDDTIRGFIKPKHIYKQLDSLAEAIKKDGGTFEIQNHVDCRGSDRCCYRLSEARAKTVMQYLISKGVSEENLSYKGFEGDVPRIYKNIELTCDYITGLDSKMEQERMHQLNRRTVVKRKL